MKIQHSAFSIINCALAALALTLWCASAFGAQRQSEALQSVAARWSSGGVSPAQLESQMGVFREDGTAGVPEMTLWEEVVSQKLQHGDEASLSCDVTRIYGHGEDVLSFTMLQGGWPARGSTGFCALSDTAAFGLFGSVNAMGHTLTWNDRNYIVQGIFKSDNALMLVQAAPESEAKMPNMQLRFANGGSRQQAEEFLARTSFSSGAILLDMPLIAWGLEALAALPALLLGAWILVRLIARGWQKRKYPRLLLADLPLLLPLSIAAICLSLRNLSLPAALIPGAWSDFSFWEALPKGWGAHLTAWLRHPTGGDIALLFAALGVFALISFAMLCGVLALSRVKIHNPMHVLIACAGCIAWMFMMALFYRGLRLGPAMWLLPGLWVVTDFALHAWGKEGRKLKLLLSQRRANGSPYESCANGADGQTAQNRHWRNPRRALHRNAETHTPKQSLTPWLFLAPSLLFVTVMVLVPFGDAVRRSFFSAMSKQFVGFKNYIAVFQNEAFKLAAKNTAKFALVCIPLLLLFSLLLALLLNASKDSRGIFKTSFLVPIAIPVASMVLLWRVVFHENGLLNAALGWVNLPSVDWLNSASAFGVLVFTYLWKNVGYDMVLWLSGLGGINPALYESAQMDGANAWKRFWRITLPGLTPTLFTITVLSLLNSFKVFREAYLIAGSYPNDSIYMLQHLFNNWFVSLDVDKMCAGAVLMALVVCGLILLLQKAWGKERA